jgi:DnaJ like chaperone protein
MGLIFICALLGLALGGTRGLLIGAVIGYVASLSLRSGARARLRPVQLDFLDATFAVMGALCKVDGRVSGEEIRAAENIFDMLRLSGGQREAAKASFNRGKAPDFDWQAEADKLAGLRFGRAPLLRLFLQLQCMAVAADGNVHPAEHALLVRLARRLGLAERDVSQLEALLRAAAAGPSGYGAAASRSRLEDAYTALGVTREASVAEIKRAYRRLVSQNHPDKLAAKGLPDSMRQLAEERTRELNVAYELIKEARGFS